ncbi:DUF177 domain-containing protein [Lachnospiraceae bacterium ZAX-1]
MRVAIADLISCENKEIEQQAEIEFTTFACRMGEFPIVKKSPFTLHLANVLNRTLEIEASTKVTVAIPCDRCLEEVDTEFLIEISKNLDLSLILKATNENESETHESEFMEETNYIAGTYLDIDQLVFGEILVNWPMKVLCKVDCKGICRQCGNNQNFAQCQCWKTELDPRMAAIQDIFNKFKEV